MTRRREVLRVLSAAASRLATAANAAGTLVVLGLVVLVNYDVVARGLFHAPFMGAVELVQFSMVLIVFLQLPDVVRVSRLTRSDGFLLILGPRMPRTARVLEFAIEAVSAGFMTLVAVAIWPEFTEMWASRDYFGIPGVFTAPWWPIKLVVFLSAALCAVLFAFKLAGAGRHAGAMADPEAEDGP
ncbi:MAG: TRAP transporter small permease [Alphaproteobacteria bacterium]|nr:MAG: TRAP transporter small permease [Alphaproteobacteria bacterium]